MTGRWRRTPFSTTRAKQPALERMNANVLVRDAFRIDQAARNDADTGESVPGSLVFPDQAGHRVPSKPPHGAERRERAGPRPRAVPKPAWYGCRDSGIAGSLNSILRLSTARGDAGGPISSTTAAHPDFTVIPRAARDRLVLSPMAWVERRSFYCAAVPARASVKKQR